MNSRFLMLALTALILAGLLVIPALSETGDEIVRYGGEARDEAAIRALLNHYESAFNERDLDWRMSLCLDTYQEFGFKNGQFLQMRDYDETRREVGEYWASIQAIDYSMDEIDIRIDGPQAFVRAYTTHLAENDRHSSVVHFTLVKIDGVWRIAWDSYNIVREYD